MTVFNGTITDGANDGTQGTPTDTPSLTNTILYNVSAGQRNAWRYVSVTVAQGSSVSSAILSVYVLNTTYDDPNVTVYCEDVDNSAALAETSNNFSDRALTTASTTWNATGVGAGWKTIDITSAVQEVISRGGWASNNALTVLMVGNSGTVLRMSSYENATSNPATLDITYTSGGGLTLKTIYYARLRRDG